MDKLYDLVLGKNILKAGLILYPVFFASGNLGGNQPIPANNVPQSP